MPLRQVLLLGGTAEARQFAGLIADRVDLTVSLAGRTSAPAAYQGRVRTGGFGGAEGLARYLVEHRIALMIDATHPFAETMAANAVAAAGTTGIPFLRLLRPPWPPEPGWTAHASLMAALDALPGGATALLTTGSVRTGPLARRPDCRLILRAIEPVDPPGSHVTVIRDRPPYALEGEIALIRDHGVSHLVTRNAGGAARARLDAAGALGLAVLMIDRPPRPDSPTVATPGEAVAWMRRHVAF